MPAGPFSPLKIATLHFLNTQYNIVDFSMQKLALEALAGGSQLGGGICRGGSATPTLGDPGNYEPSPPEPLQLKLFGELMAVCI